MVVGAFVGEKPDFTLVAHFGILSHDIAMISLNKAHYINQGINKNKALSVNIVDESRLEKAAVAGSVSGRVKDKSSLFEYGLGETNAPIINDAKLSMECVV